MVASENPLRPSARSLAARVAFTCHAIPYIKPRRALHFGLHLKVSGISLFVFHSRIVRNDWSNLAITAILPFCSNIFFYLDHLPLSISLGLPSFSLFLSSSFLSLFSSSNFSFSLSRRNSRFPALSKINTSQRGLKTCVNMVLHCLYVHITLSAPGYYHHTEPRRPLRRPSRLLIAVVQVRGG